jgi:nitrate/TMAO reductase-like tetraheme cytochrome c subunit
MERVDMRRLVVSGLLVLVGVLSAASARAQQDSRCADCHFARPDAPAQDHLREWDRSPHGRNNVGCQKCHGGNETTVESFLAHRGILPSVNPESPVNRTKLPATCGACHVGPFVAFQDSRHYQLLQTGDRRGPTCSTCHGEADGRLLSAKALESRCNECHGPGEVAPRAERARQVRQLYEGLTVVREQIKLAENFVRRITERERRAQMQEQLDQAKVPLERAVNAGHKFVYDDLQSSLATAQTRVSDLLERLANQPARRP